MGKPMNCPVAAPLWQEAAVQRGVGSQQRKAVLVLVDLLDRNLPALYAVALLAIGAELALVDVGMAIGALLAHIRKYRFDVALGTGDSLMHTAQRVTGLVMVELGHVADRLPSAEGVAILAGNIQAGREGYGCWRRSATAPRRTGRRPATGNATNRYHRIVEANVSPPEIGFDRPNTDRRREECDDLSTTDVSASCN